MIPRGLKENHTGGLKRIPTVLGDLKRIPIVPGDLKRIPIVPGDLKRIPNSTGDLCRYKYSPIERGMGTRSAPMEICVDTSTLL